MRTDNEYLVGREICALRCESVGEYSLPDYNGDVKRVLAVNTRVSPAGKFVGEDTLEISGSVAYDVVYVDSEDNVTHAEFSTDYDTAVRINSDVYVDSLIETKAVGCNLRLVGPRKLSVKCSLESNAVISEQRVHSVSGDAFLEYEPEVSTSVANVLGASFATGERRELTEEMARLDGAISDEVEILLSDARFSLDGIFGEGESAEIKGSIKTSLLYRNGDDKPCLITREIPYSEELSLDRAEGAALTAHVEVSGVKAVVEPTDDGVALSISLSVAPGLCAVCNEPLRLVGDAYLKERGSENEYTDFSYTEHICTESKEARFEGRTSLSDIGIESFGEVVWSDATAKVDECTLGEGGVKITGEIRFSGIACVEDGELYVKCYPIKFTLPFEENVNINCQKHDNTRIKCNVDAIESKIEISDNDVIGTCTLDISLSISADKRQRCLGASYLTDEEYLRDDSVITVYYPDSSESLFEIAKMFHTSVSAIAASNRLSESVFASADQPVGISGITRLIIK